MPKPALAVVAGLLLAGGAVALTVAVLGDGDGSGDSSNAGRSTVDTVSRLGARVTELETSITEYCEIRSSGAASSGDEETAADAVQELIRLARWHPDRRLGPSPRPTVRDALADVSIVLSADCEGSSLQRPVNRALEKLR